MTEPEAAGEPPPRRQPRSRHPRRRRWIGLAMIFTGGLILLTGAWVAVTGLLARGQLASVRTEVHQLRADISGGNLAEARKTATELSKHAHRAHQLTTGPAWALAAQLPAGGEPIRTVRGITASADALGHQTLPALIAARDDLDATTLRDPAGTIDVARIAAVAPSLDTADAAMTKATKKLAGLPKQTWLPTVDHARTDVLTQLLALGRTVRSADLAAHILPTMLGSDGPKRYFVGFQNDAEARGTGGLPGAFAIVVADHGRLRFTHFESDSTLGFTPTGLNLGPDYAELYGNALTTSLYVNTNLSPHFPYAAQIWAAMWHKHSGEHVDGAIAVDPTALSYLLAVTGPATLPDKSQVSAGNVVALTQSTVYATIADTAVRKAYLRDVAKAISTHILDDHGSTSALVDAGGRAAGERRLMVWSAEPAVEAQIEQTSLSGSIPATRAPYVGLSIVNDGGNKLDYYLDRSLRWQRTGCGSTRQVTVTITLTNNAPASGLSPYVTSRTDQHGYPVKPGDSRLEVGYLATDGALMDSVTANGRPSTASIGVERGHPVYTVDLELPRGTTRTVVLHLVEPAASGSPVVLRQALVRPLSVTLDDTRCN